MAPTRDMVFCHECQNEWYRDEHGLSCPDCHSDFTEIIEPQHDPREELLADDVDDSDDLGDLPDFRSIHAHDPWAHDHQQRNQDNAPDPDEDDISNMQWRSNGPGSLSFQFSRTISPTQRYPTQGQQDAPAADPLMLNFATMLNGIVGGGASPNPQQPPGNVHTGREEGTHDDTGLAGQGDRANRDTEPGTQFFQGGGPGFTWTASTRLLPRNTNAAQPQVQRIDNLQSLLNQMFTVPAGGEPFQTPDRGNGPAFPLGLFAGLFNPANMQHGDAVYSQEALDRIVSQLMEQNASGNAPGPASAEAIANLPQKTIAQSDLDDQGHADCSICMEPVQIGDKVTLLPCSHWFHGDCIRVWLGEHDTCPHCRSGIMPRDAPPDAAAPRSPSQPPRHDSNWTQSAGDSSFTTPAGPTQERRPSSSTGAGGGGILDRMRNAFGGGSPGAPPGSQG